MGGPDFWIGHSAVSQTPSGAVPSRRLAAALTKNVENNPMHSNRRPSQPTVGTENLTHRANQRHDFTIPKSEKRPRAGNRCYQVNRGLHRGAFNASAQSYSSRCESEITAKQTMDAGAWLTVKTVSRATLSC